LYTLCFLGKALDDLQRIERPFRLIIKEKLQILAKNPMALKNNIKRLSGKDEELYRLRIGKHRVIFKKENKTLLILIIRVGHRKDIYSG
jgi:mRNA interferase RelE/StbE